jgi:hypothetical protein
VDEVEDVPGVDFMKPFRPKVKTDKNLIWSNLCL